MENISLEILMPNAEKQKKYFNKLSKNLKIYFYEFLNFQDLIILEKAARCFYIKEIKKDLSFLYFLKSLRLTPYDLIMPKQFFKNIDNQFDFEFIDLYSSYFLTLRNKFGISIEFYKYILKTYLYSYSHTFLPINFSKLKNSFNLFEDGILLPTFFKIKLEYQADAEYNFYHSKLFNTNVSLDLLKLDCIIDDFKFFTFINFMRKEVLSLSSIKFNDKILNFMISFIKEFEKQIEKILINFVSDYNIDYIVDYIVPKFKNCCKRLKLHFGYPYYFRIPQLFDLLKSFENVTFTFTYLDNDDKEANSSLAVKCLPSYKMIDHNIKQFFQSNKNYNKFYFSLEYLRCTKKFILIDTKFSTFFDFFPDVKLLSNYEINEIDFRGFYGKLEINLLNDFFINISNSHKHIEKLKLGFVGPIDNLGCEVFLNFRNLKEITFYNVEQKYKFDNLIGKRNFEIQIYTHKTKSYYKLILNTKKNCLKIHSSVVRRYIKVPDMTSLTYKIEEIIYVGPYLDKFNNFLMDYWRLFRGLKKVHIVTRNYIMEPNKIIEIVERLTSYPTFKIYVIDLCISLIRNLNLEHLNKLDQLSKENKVFIMKFNNDFKYYDLSDL